MKEIHEIFFSNSSNMEKIKTVIEKIAKTDIPVLIKGESGTGKEIIAQTIHQKSRRLGKPFIKVNCAAIPEDLLESELFGFEKGAFTGAHLKKPGKFELADGGTILLNEIGEMSVFIQAKLLQVLQNGEFSRLGGEGDIRVDTRVICTTKDQLEKSMIEGRFRKDLFFRINVMNIVVPPLRNRREQIPSFSQYFFHLYKEKYGKSTPYLSPQTLAFFMEYDWPGNIRELENMIKRIVLFGEEEAIGGSVQENGNGGNGLIPMANFQPNGSSRMRGVNLKRVSKEAAEIAEKGAIQKTLQVTCWNRKRAAKLLGISYKALLYKIQKYQMEEVKKFHRLKEDGE